MISLRKKVFNKIYDCNSWGGKSRSGPGSDPQNTQSYIRFVNQWLTKHPECESIVELGCGDWATTRLINLSTQHTYLGMDIVDSVVNANNALFQSESIKFECSDFLTQIPPIADLLLIKDVLQHLANDNVKLFLQKILPRYKYAIITNDVGKYEEWKRFGSYFGRRKLQEPNIDISDGNSRPLKLDKPPFELKVSERSTYSVLLSKNLKRLIYVKDILVWCNDKTITV